LALCFWLLGARFPILPFTVQLRPLDSVRAVCRSTARFCSGRRGDISLSVFATTDLRLGRAAPGASSRSHCDRVLPTEPGTYRAVWVVRASELCLHALVPRVSAPGRARPLDSRDLADSCARCPPSIARSFHGGSLLLPDSPRPSARGVAAEGEVTPDATPDGWPEAASAASTA